MLKALFVLTTILMPLEAFSEGLCLELLSPEQPVVTRVNLKEGPESNRQELADFYKNFEHSDAIKKGSVAHGVMAQTSWLTGLSLEELESRLEDLGDISDISGDLAAGAILLQTALLKEENLSVVLEYFRNFPDPILKRDFTSALILMQTAFITNSNPQEVIEYFDSFPRTMYTRKEIGFGIIIQSAFLTQLEPRTEAQVAFRRIFPNLFAFANKGFNSIYRQSSLFAERAFTRSP